MGATLGNHVEQVNLQRSHHAQAVNLAHLVLLDQQPLLPHVGLVPPHVAPQSLPQTESCTADCTSVHGVASLQLCSSPHMTGPMAAQRLECREPPAARPALEHAVGCRLLPPVEYLCCKLILAERE